MQLINTCTALTFGHHLDVENPLTVHRASAKKKPTYVLIVPRFQRTRRCFRGGKEINFVKSASRNLQAPAPDTVAELAFTNGKNLQQFSNLIQVRDEKAEYATNARGMMPTRSTTAIVLKLPTGIPALK